MKKIVIARYNENIDWIKNINFDFIVYNKGSNDLNISNTLIQNKGRESDTYLNFILDYYNNLPEQIIFCQGNPFDHCENFIDLINKEYTEDLVYLAYYIATDDDRGCPNHCGLNIKEILLDLNLENPEKFTFSAGAQYIVSKELIQNKSLDWWKNCYKIYNNHSLSPWVFERIWPLIFKYEHI
jgi:hypothetical protein